MRCQNYADKIGVVGAVVAAACCLGLPWLIGILFGIGLGLMVNDAVLIPLVIIFLAVMLTGLGFGMRIHRRPWALLLGAASSLLVLFFVLVIFSEALVWLGLAGIIGSVLLNAWLRNL